ncbi:MAG: histidinol phosphate phosphatase domain-containing protein [Clostridia bacterium]
MKVDYHVHLEEGPYSLRWWQRTAEALLSFDPIDEQAHSRAWMESIVQRMGKRVAKGAYSQEWLDLYRRRAKELRLQQVGIVDHLYRFKEYKAYFETHLHVADDQLGRLQRVWLEQVCTESIDEFVAFIQEQKNVWAADGISLRLGIEADFFPQGEEVLRPLVENYPWDHVIGSIHYVDGWGFDNPDTRERFDQEDLGELYRKGFLLVEQAISSGLFDIIAHMDNLKVFGHRLSAGEMLPHYRRIAALLQAHDTATEINTGLYYRYPVKEMCPAFDFLQIVCEHGVPITTSSDSHFPDHVGSYLDEARELLKQAGYGELATFEGRKRKLVSLD